MLTRLVAAAVCSLAAIVGAGTAQARDAATASCSDIVGHGRPSTDREPIPAAAVPAAFLPNVGSDPSAAPFSFWTKAGIVVRADTAVTITVAPQVARRVRITWGGGTGATIRFAACHTGARWNAYAGGFLARTPTACVPLIVSSGGRHTIVTFGLGRRCPRKRVLREHAAAQRRADDRRS